MLPKAGKASDSNAPVAGYAPTRALRRRPGPPLRARPGSSQVGWLQSLDVVRLCLVGITAVTISSVHVFLGPVRYTRPSLSLLVIIFAVLLIKPRLVEWSNLRSGWPAKAVMGLLVLAGASAIFGLSFGQSASYLLDRYTRALIYFFLLVVAIRNIYDFKVLMWGFVISTGLLVVLSVTVMNVEVTQTGLGRIEGQGGYDANDLGMIFLMALPLALLFFFNSGRLGRVMSALVIGGIPVAIALTGSRGALVGLIVVGPAIFLALGRFGLGKRTLVAIILAGGLFFGAPDGYWDQMGTLLNPTEDYNYSVDYGRRGLAIRGFKYMMDYPVFGVGISNFGRAEGTISPIAGTRALQGLSVQWIAPHNTYIQVGAEMGVPALILWLSLLWGGTFGLWKLRKRIPVAWETESPDRKFLREATLFLPVSFVAFAVTSSFLSHAYSAPVYIIIALLTGLLILVNREFDRDDDDHAGGTRRRPLGAHR